MNRKQSFFQHKQVPAKVTAYVDEGIKDLVEMLNTIPKVCTIESCEGSNTRSAFVSLDYGVDYDDNNYDLHALVEFADKLWGVIKNAVAQEQVSAGLMEYTTISIEWHPRYHPTLWINVGKQYLKDLVNILRLYRNGHKVCRQQSKFEN